MNHQLDPQRMQIQTHQDRIRELVPPTDRGRSSVRPRLATRARATVGRWRATLAATRGSRAAPGRHVTPGAGVRC